MNNEIELKLAVSSASFSLLERHLQQFTPLEHGSIFLANTYYDYSDHFLAKQKMGLRIRQEEQTFTLTLKTDGTVTGGLHNRPEYNLSLMKPRLTNNYVHYILLNNYRMSRCKSFFRRILTALFG